MAEVFTTYRPRVLAAFNAVYASLAADVPRRLADWRVGSAHAVRGILELKNAGSGSLDLSDGYVATWPRTGI
jgi:hypothetical protein